MLKEIIEMIPIKEIMSEGIRGMFEMAGKFSDNYYKRRNSGFDFNDSLKGSWNETSHYYGDSWNGRQPKEYIQGVYFEGEKGYDER